MTRTHFISTTVISLFFILCGTAISDTVDEQTMQAVYEEVKTPYKYGIVIDKDDEQSRSVDCPTVFRYGDYWYMMHVQSEKSRAGYTTQLARSDDLLNWERLGTILPQGDTGDWDYANAAGGIALADTQWAGDGIPGTYNDRYWLSYFGGELTGYETAPLSISRACTTDPSVVAYWTKDGSPIFAITDSDAGSWEDYTLYKSFILEDPDLTLGTDARFVMYYNAKGDSNQSEYIGMATSPDMKTWTRYTNNPIIVNGDSSGAISGDPQIVKMGEVWVMFYFGTGWGSGCCDTFACSHDLVNWTKWDGDNLIEPTSGTDSYDKTFAHKPWIVKYDGIVYHFYCAVGSEGRVIALATSVDLREDVAPPTPDPMTWENSPNALDGNTIIMTATTAIDTTGGIEYYFENETIIDGSHDSGWQTSPTYIDRDLSLKTQYTYNVKARDLLDVPNVTDPSSSASATTTSTVSDTTAPTPNPLTWSVNPYCMGNSISMTASKASNATGVEYYFVNETLSSHDSGWQSSRTYLDTGLLPNTSYTYSVLARDRNSNQNETDPSNSASATTDSIESISINFQPTSSSTPSGFVADNGDVFGDRGNGMNYGWNLDHSKLTRLRSNLCDQELRTMIHILYGGIWEMQVANGEYHVEVAIGDADYSNVHTVNVEGVNYCNSLALDKLEFEIVSHDIEVTDGRITLDTADSGNKSTRICYVVITSISTESL